MHHYEQEIDLYFELKDTPASSRESYLRRINAFVNFMQDRHKCVEDITESDIQQYILYLKREKGLLAGTINNYISSIKFFLTYVLGKEWNSKKIPRMKRMPRFPLIPPKQDVLAILSATANLKHKAILVLIYGSGLRVGEVARLKIGDICSKSMRVRVEYAKHNTNRYTPSIIPTGIPFYRIQLFLCFESISGHTFLPQATSLATGCFQGKTKTITFMLKP